MATMEFAAPVRRPPGVVIDDAPLLVEWVTGPEAALMLGISRQAVHRLMQQGFFASLHRLGLEDAKHPIYVVRRSEVMAEAARRSDAVARMTAKATALRQMIGAVDDGEVEDDG